MTHEEADEGFGPIVFKSSNYVVRVIEKEDGLHVIAHRLSSKGEELPRGYMLGDNALFFPVKKN